jgi:hypothetical protein
MLPITTHIQTLGFIFYHLAAAVFYETHQPALLAAHMMVELYIHSHDGIYTYILFISNLKY